MSLKETLKKIEQARAEKHAKAISQSKPTPTPTSNSSTTKKKSSSSSSSSKSFKQTLADIEQARAEKHAKAIQESTKQTMEINTFPVPKSSTGGRTKENLVSSQKPTSTSGFSFVQPYDVQAKGYQVQQEEKKIQKQIQALEQQEKRIQQMQVTRPNDLSYSQINREIATYNKQIQQLQQQEKQYQKKYSEYESTYSQFKKSSQYKPQSKISTITTKPQQIDWTAKALEKGALIISNLEKDMTRGTQRTERLVRSTGLFRQGSFAEEYIVGSLSAPFNLVLGTGRAGIATATLLVAQIKYPKQRDAIKEQQKEMRTAGIGTLKDWKTYATAGISAIGATIPFKAPSFKFKSPTQSPTTTTTSSSSFFSKLRADKTTAGKYKGTSNNFAFKGIKENFIDIKVGRDLTGKRTFTGVETTSGKRQPLTREQVSLITIGKRGQAKSPFSLIEQRTKSQTTKSKIKKDIQRYKPKTEVKALTTKTRFIVPRPTPIPKPRPIEPYKPRPPKPTPKPKAIEPYKPPKTNPIERYRPPKVPDKIKPRPIEPYKPPKQLDPYRPPKPRPKEPITGKKGKTLPPPWFFPKIDLDLGGGGGGGFFKPKDKSIGSRQTKYTPSIVASTFQIYGDAPSSFGLTGLEFRPLLKEDNKKKKKKVY